MEIKKRRVNATLFAILITLTSELNDKKYTKLLKLRVNATLFANLNALTSN